MKLLNFSVSIVEQNISTW